MTTTTESARAWLRDCAAPVFAPASHIHHAGLFLALPALENTGLLVAVGDEHGRLLWVEGDSAARRHGEGINFARGADWSETAVGTSAPGTALVLGKSVQIMGEEHFNPAIHSWSCTAVPLHDPDSGSILGIVDITGGPEAVGANTLSLVQASVAAAQAQLRIQRLELRSEQASVP
ncbi:transcriptional regulator of acetoin/glycerol metabolism [Arthrobacter stackebrandtii]|uniref:Transcriptional regulator of acetoin/glycerol metabolism n=1 Tax=Arthrobacter stackebrandtii TaxID=272161 RepID=A0ABS4YRR0_9MICC|nr:transcriptional regulator of acetoin/glycerol metabolism [Arthrobacter stackebrandtii]